MYNDRPNLVLLHGWGMNNAVWDALPATLTDRFQLHPIELPGHGQARFEPQWRDLPDWADTVLAQAPEQAIWLGWSLGALVALQAALQTRVPGRSLGPGQQVPAEDKPSFSFATSDGQPSNRDKVGSPSSASNSIHISRSQPTSRSHQRSSRISALILVTANPRFVQAADWQAAMPDEIFEGFHASLLDDPNATLERFLSLQVRGSEEAREILRRLRAGIAERPQPQPEALLAGLDLLREEDLRARLADIPQPALWLFGERDTLVPAAVAERIELLMPNARCQTISGAAHAPLLSHGDAVAAAIVDFLYGASA
ncbi:MAG: alpha/beta fold hydrolase [Lamprobacter sp.]|uniref:alpha/beta fold hydrolase n=1 Tax=Lamprobacter sp. TaxID=3100796 RepID=UPI002B259281|nr:alpha/beta fold hydrolase [Lamprobacter sp.]MEA3640686.1 alpha/beta fold hydrolase [Lamprobacter sp.]